MVVVAAEAAAESQLLRSDKWVFEGRGVGDCGAQEGWSLCSMRRIATHSPTGPGWRCHGSSWLGP